MNIGALPDRILIKGDTFKQALTFTKLVDDVTEPIDLSVYTDIRMDVRDAPSQSATKFITVSLGNGITISGDDNNILLIEIPSTETEKLITTFNQFDVNSVNRSSATLQNSRKLQEYSYYYRDIRFIIGSDISTKLNGKLLVLNNITEIPDE